MPEELWTEFCDIVQEAVIKIIPKKKYEAKTQQRGWHLDWSRCLGQVAGLCSAGAVCSLPHGRRLEGQHPTLGSSLSCGGQMYLWSLSQQDSPYAWTGVGCGDGIYFLSLFKGACDIFQNVKVQGLGTHCTFDVYIHYMSFHSGLMELIWK